MRVEPPRLCDLHRKTGISVAHLSKIFSGTRTPSLANAALIASARKISIDELYAELVEIQRRVDNEEATATA